MHLVAILGIALREREDIVAGSVISKVGIVTIRFGMSATWCRVLSPDVETHGIFLVTNEQDRPALVTSDFGVALD